jgi:hypothetical protein
MRQATIRRLLDTSARSLARHDSGDLTKHFIPKCDSPLPGFARQVSNNLTKLRMPSLQALEPLCKIVFSLIKKQWGRLHAQTLTRESSGGTACRCSECECFMILCRNRLPVEQLSAATLSCLGQLLTGHCQGWHASTGNSIYSSAQCSQSLCEARNSSFPGTFFSLHAVEQ